MDTLAETIAIIKKEIEKLDRMELTPGAEMKLEELKAAIEKYERDIAMVNNMEIQMEQISQQAKVN